MNTSDFAQRLADKLIAQLREGTAPWQKPWTEGQAFGPYNPTTGNRYRGINVLALLGDRLHRSPLDDVQASASPGLAGEGRGDDRPKYSTGFGRRSECAWDKMASRSWTVKRSSSRTAFVWSAPK